MRRRREIVGRESARHYRPLSLSCFFSPSLILFLLVVSSLPLLPLASERFHYRRFERVLLFPIYRLRGNQKLGDCKNSIFLWLMGKFLRTFWHRPSCFVTEGGCLNYGGESLKQHIFVLVRHFTLWAHTPFQKSLSNSPHSTPPTPALAAVSALSLPPVRHPSPTIHRRTSEF